MINGDSYEAQEARRNNLPSCRQKYQAGPPIIGRSEARPSQYERSHHGAVETMSRSIQSRGNSRQGVRLAQVRSRRRRTRRPIFAAIGRGHSAARVIGLPLEVTFPRLKGIRSRYCTRWDEGPAAVLGMSLLRLGICLPNDWSGSAVDFVEHGFRRFCAQNRAADAKSVWVGDLRITDSLFRAERARAKSG